MLSVVFVGEESPYASIFYVGTCHVTSLHKKYAAIPSAGRLPRNAPREKVSMCKEGD